MKRLSFTPLFFLFTLTILIFLGTSSATAQKNTSNDGIPISGKWEGWGTMTITYENSTIKGTYSDTYSDKFGYIEITKENEIWKGVWEEKSINRKGSLFNVIISKDGKSINGHYSVTSKGALSNGSKLPHKENVPFHWTLVMADNPQEQNGEEDNTNTETDNNIPPQELCKKKHKVNMKSTMWIADMDLEKEMVEYQAFLDRNKVPLNKQAERIAVFNSFALGTNTFPDDGSHAEPSDPSQRKFRIASEFNFDIEVVDGKLVRAAAVGQPYTRGGFEGVGLYGSSHGKVLNELMSPDKYTCRYIIYGDPHWLANLALNRVEIRTSTRIWHYIEIEITPQPDCSVKKRARFRASSAFPSHRIWIDDAEVNYTNNRANARQGNVIQLWESSEVDIEKKSRRTDLPANDFAFLLRFMGKDIKQWVRPRFNPKSLLSWPGE